ncbi:uncharacterized protein LOC128888624 [Hylaeus anthracinus]|uniref:uncharacterized protein LOC128888624 n=1 Tax=Hylaeus anthracinus TaxID=313031 RepID=UPI0023B9EC12|nr:uncharacterized protein LOC128888624 [Hylaeus anthracinus]
MPGEKGKRKRSRSKSKSKERKKQRTEDRLQNIEKQLYNLTKSLSQIIQETPVKLGNNKENVDTPNTSQANIDQIETTSAEIPETEEITQITDDIPPMNEGFLEMLGEHPNTKKEISIKINEELKIRWQKWMREGYPEENKKNILEIYPRKDDLYTEAPKINIEISPVMTEIATKRDEHFAETQNCIGSAISALGAAVSMILENPEDGIDQEALMKYLCDAGKLLTDTFYQHLVARRAYITPLMSKSIRPTIDATKADE